MRAGGDDDVTSVPGSASVTTRNRAQPARAGGDLHDGGMRDDGRLEGGGVPFQVLDQLGELR